MWLRMAATSLACAVVVAIVTNWRAEMPEDVVNWYSMSWILELNESLMLD